MCCVEGVIRKFDHVLIYCFTMFQVYYEFSRVVGKHLRENFFDALDHFSPSLMDLFRNKRGLTGQVLAELLRHTKVSCLHYPCLVKFLFDLCSFLVFFYHFSPFLHYSFLFIHNSFLTSASFDLICLPLIFFVLFFFFSSVLFTVALFF